ncbi:tripartite tricarboxylate transporter TctB family protein [Arenivirga flava]|uniref:DUF1468 domain-containing protein n=1 Tax=Arenivirga flava TaxID=1930060 RepID=A0AA37UKY5_9MICO|nr:tripartite tricarboxylate transporter TctB family protein [Arenivirga flava]GMA28347.1 hypothetical protein GCM10025874_16000 [Arenivirga flava]
MTATEHERGTGSTQGTDRSRWLRRRVELVVPVAVLILAVGLGIGTAAMEVPPNTAAPGPRFFPTIVALLLGVLAVAYAISVVRNPRELPEDSRPGELSADLLEDLGRLDATSEIGVVDPEHPRARAAAAARAADAAIVERPGLDWRNLLLLVGALAGFVLVLEPVGWLLSSAALFWTVCRIFGSRRPLFDIGVSALVAGTVQLAFSAGLGLSLPSGIFEGVFAWIS